MAHPVHVRIEYRARHSRSRTLLRALMVVPHLVVLLVLQLATAILLVIAWLAILATGRYPRPLFGFVAGMLRYATRIGCYWLLLADRFPPFGLGSRTDGYPVDVWVDQPERLSRLTTGLRLLLAIPAWLILYFLALFSLMMSFAAWWVILATGRLPHGMFEVMELPASLPGAGDRLCMAPDRRIPVVPGGMRFRTRSMGYRDGDRARP